MEPCSPDGLWHREHFKNPGSELEDSEGVVIVRVASPVLLHAVDQYGRHVGVNETGDIEVEIPEAEYSGPDAHPQEIAIYNDSLNMTFYTTGIDEGTFNLSIERGGVLQRELYTFSDVPTTNSTIAYVYESQLNELKVDQDGDGVIDEVLSNPVPWFEISPEKPQAGEEVTFNASSSYVPDEQVNYTWDFGDNGSAIGKIVQHEYKEPGYYSIKLTISGSETSYEKTLQIDPPPEEVIEEPNTSPSSGGGGGGASAGVSVSVSSIEAGEAAVFDFSGKMEELMSEIVLFTKQAAYNVKITIESLDAKPYASLPDPAGEVYKYLKITTSNLPATSIDKAEIKFKVNKSWLKENDIDQSTVALNRNVQSRWDILATTKVDSGDTYVYYTAETPGFSYFTITAEKGSGYVGKAVPIATQAPITAPPITTPAPTTPVPTTPAPTTTVLPTKEPKSPTGKIILALVAIVIIAGAAYYFYRKRDKRT